MRDSFDATLDERHRLLRSPECCRHRRASVLQVEVEAERQPLFLYEQKRHQQHFDKKNTMIDWTANGLHTGTLMRSCYKGERKCVSINTEGNIYSLG